MKVIKYKCPCCGYYTMNEAEGSFDVCPVCYWEDDSCQNRDPDFDGGANKVSLNEAKANFAKYGACIEELVPFVRRPLDSENSPEQEPNMEEDDYDLYVES